MKPSTPISSHGQAVPDHQHTATWLRTQLAARRATRFEARASVSLDLALGGVSFPFPVHGGACLLTIDNGEVVALFPGLTPADAQERAAELNTQRCATGFHLWS